MRIFNRVVMIVLLGGLFVAGVYAVVYAFDLFGYALQSLLRPVAVLRRRRVELYERRRGG